jgi:precorrin-6Y C5,15-methyltransferase (decarboxylating)
VSERRVIVIGLPPDGGSAGVSPAARAALADADIVAGARRHLEELTAAGRFAIDADTIQITGDLTAALDAIAAAHAAGRRVVVVATGDPGYFGIGRALAERLGPSALDVRPALSSVATAFGRLGLPWDDAVVVSAHGRPIAEAVAAVGNQPKVAVLTSPDNTPERVGAELARAGARYKRVIVASELGFSDEQVREGPGVEWLAAGHFPALSVVVLLAGSGVGPKVTVASGGSGAARPDSAATQVFGLDESQYEHRDGMVTKAEVRAVVLARLALPASAGVLWDVGAGSGSIGIEAAALAPAMRVYAVEQGAEDSARVRANAERRGVRVEVVEGSAPAALDGLPAPDRAIVGGGGLEVLDAVLARLVPGGRVVATFASLDRAVAAAGRLGSLTQVSINRGTRLADSTLRLVALDPVFVCWGPT